MNEQYIAVRLIHDFILDRPPSTNDLDNRVIAQKIVYLASSLGVECGDFEFNWYKRGPYSPALTRVLYDNNIDENFYAAFQLKEESKRILHPLKSLLSKNPTNMKEVDWIELLASTHFLLKKHQDIFKAVGELIMLKPKYTKDDVYLAGEYLEKYEM